MTVSIKTWVTFASTDSEGLQALVLGQSLRRVLTKWRLLVFTNNQLSNQINLALKGVFDAVVVPDGIGHKNGFSFELFAKLSAWNLYMANRCIFIQPDSIVLKNCDELMESVGEFLVASDGNEIDSSLFICKPSTQTFQTLVDISKANKISQDPSKLFELHWGKKLNRLDDGIFMSKSPSDPTINPQNVQVPIVRLKGASPNNLIQLEEELDRGNLMKVSYTSIRFPDDYVSDNCAGFGLGFQYLLGEWLTIFHTDVKPLLNCRDNQGLSTVKKMPSLEPIAIVGMGCRLPGANTVSEFWKLLIEGRDMIGSLPLHRLTPGISADKIKSMKAGFLKCPINECEGKFFGISPAELSFLDPQTRILLEVLWEALEDAAVDPTSLKGTNAGIFAGAWTQDYKELMNRATPPTQAFFRKYMGNSFGAAAGRLSFILGVTGPNVATESGCSSSMIGLDIACNKLRLGETGLAMACGVNLVLHEFNENDMDSICAVDGHCKTFDAAADGFGRAEGCGVLVLKRYSDAVRDGDRIHALIRGMGAAQEGNSRSFGTPTVASEASAMKLALKAAGVAPSEVSYVESHGTGTPVGDPMEMAAIAAAYSEGRTEALIVGSVKTNVGHTESCSGITGIIKTVLSLQNEVIPPHLNFKSLNPNVNLDAVPARIPITPVPWPRQKGKVRYAGVSSFGITGTDAHAIIQEAPEVQPRSTFDFRLTRPQHLVTLSAKTEPALTALLSKYKEHLELEQTDLGDIAFTANTGRAHFSHRAAIIGATSSEILKNMEKKSFVQGRVPEERPKICFLFTGQGSQYIGMGKTLYETSPEFRFHFDACETTLRDKFGISIRPVLWPSENTESELSRTIYSQTSIFCIEYCLLKLYESWGVKPNWVLGHSLGEFAAAAAGGILILDDAITLVAERSRLIDDLPRGSMIVIKRDKTSVDEILKQFKGIDPEMHLDFAALNSKEQTVLAGNSEAVKKLQIFCLNNKIKSTVLEATHAFHSRDMEPMLEEYAEIASKIKYGTPTCQFISGMEGKVMASGEVDANYWVRHTREGVNFSDACDAAFAEGCQLFLEIGPQPVLSALTVGNSSDYNSISCLPSLRRNRDDWNTILTTLSKLYVSGVKVDWKNFDKFYRRRKVTLPTYPFQRKKFWFDSQVSNSGNVQLFSGTPLHPLLGSLVPNATSSSIYQGLLDLDQIPYVRDHVIGETVIFPGAGFLEMSLAGGYSTSQALNSKFLFPTDPISFTNFVIEAPLQLLEGQGSPVQVIVSPDESSGSKVSVFRELDLGDGSPKKWVRHSSGNFLPFRVDFDEEKPFLNQDFKTIRERMPKEMDIDKFYRNCESQGLKFGPKFRTVVKYWKNHALGEMFGEIVGPPGPGSDYLCHPVIIDALIQGLIANQMDEIGQLLVPVRIGKFIWFAPIDTERLYIHSFPRPGSTVPSSAALYNSNGKLLALMSQVELVGTTVPAILTALKNQKLTLPPMYEEVWRGTSGPLQNRIQTHRVFGPDLFPEEFCTEMLKFNEEREEDKELLPQSNRLCYLYVLKALYDVGWEPEIGQVLQASDFCARYSISSAYVRFVNRLFQIVGEEGHLSGVQDELGRYISWTLTSVPPTVDHVLGALQLTKTILSAGTSQAYSATNVVVNCGEKLSSVLLGKAAPVDILFSQDNGQESAADAFYRDCNINKYLVQPPVIQKLVESVHEYMQNSGNNCKEVFKILEVGAGTGSTTKLILPALEQLQIPYKYTFTDISAGFFGKAEKVFEPYAKKMEYGVFDLEKDPIDQGFCPEQFDLIIGANVLHICKDLSQCMRNLRLLTTSGGLVYIFETTRPWRDVDLVFGLFEDYWLYEDVETRANHCLVSSDTWMTLFRANGYESGRIFGFHCDRGGLMIGKASKNRPIYRSKGLQAKPKSWIIFSGTQVNTTRFFTDRLRSVGRGIVQIKQATKFDKINDDIYEVSPHIKSDLEFALADIKNRNLSVEGVIYLWGNEEGELDQRQICEPFLYLSQSIAAGVFKPFPKLFVLTTGAHLLGDHVISNPSGNTLWGFAKSLRAEVSALHCKTIDMDPTSNDEERLEEAFLEMWKTDGENQVTFRQRNRHLNRLTPGKFQTPLTLPNSDKFSLALSESRTINDLRIVPQQSTRVLKDEEVEIETRVIALNFKDIFAIMKPIQEFERFNSVGADFAGYISAVGRNVKDKKVGDAVVGCIFDGGAVPSHHVISSSAVFPVPSHWTLAEAATMPAVFATAYYCMVTVANLRPNETVLIHAASGGVGLVAIQIAKYLGCRIIATAGSERKRAYLRNLGIQHVYNSRTLEFEEQILELTGGGGVEMVLNCLTGPGFKEASLSVCAPGARFVEMSKLEVWTPEEVTTRRPDVAYTIVDLTLVSGEVWLMLMRKLEELMNSNVIRPIPYTAFDMVHVREALGYLQSAKHIGKVTINMPTRALTSNGELETKFNLFNDKSSYLITGGLGGIGLEVAKWMVQSGAKHLVLVGRSLPNPNAVEAIASLIRGGANVVTLQVDVGDYGQCDQLLQNLKAPSSGLPQLRGIMHAAGTLSDALIDNQNWSKFDSTFHPKVTGAWNLHNLTMDYPLEHFVMYSSVVALLGNFGQTNHAAGNAFLDGLAYYRASIGLPALTINWGQWGEVGVAAEIKTSFLRPFSPKEGVLALESWMKSHKTRGVAFDGDFAIIRQLVPNIGKYLDEFRSIRPSEGPVGTGDLDSKAFADEFAGAGSEELKLAVVKKYAEKLIGRILKLDSDEEVDPNQDFLEQGLDSLMMVELKNSAQSFFGNNIVISASELAECSTLQRFSQHITNLLINA